MLDALARIWVFCVPRGLHWPLEKHALALHSDLARTKTRWQSAVFHARLRALWKLFHSENWGHPVVLSALAKIVPYVLSDPVLVKSANQNAYSGTVGTRLAYAIIQQACNDDFTVVRLQIAAESTPKVEVYYERDGNFLHAMTIPESLWKPQRGTFALIREIDIEAMLKWAQFDYSALPIIRKIEITELEILIELDPKSPKSPPKDPTVRAEQEVLLDRLHRAIAEAKITRDVELS